VLDRRASTARRGKHAYFLETAFAACPGTGILSSRHFPEDFQGNFLNINVIGFQGIFRVKVTEEGSGITGETIKDNLVSSDDPNFRLQPSASRPTALSISSTGTSP